MQTTAPEKANLADISLRLFVGINSVISYWSGMAWLLALEGEVRESSNQTIPKVLVFKIPLSPKCVLSTVSTYT
jgi:hypothetical protein